MPERIFDFEGPVARFIFRVKDLFVLNFLTLLCMIPVFTFGPALKALAFTCLKMVREEDGNVVQTYFKNFKLNFRQTVVFGIVCLLLIAVAAGDLYILVFNRDMLPSPIMIIPCIIALFIVFMILVYAVPMQGRFLNPVLVTFKNSFWIALLKFPKTILMMGCWIVLPGFYMFVSGNFFPLIVLFGLSLPAYLNAVLYEPLFREIEKKIRGEEDEDLQETAETKEETDNTGLAETEHIMRKDESEI